MASVSITIPDALIARLTAAAKGTYPQYAALTPTDLFKAITSDMWKNLLADFEYQESKKAQAITADAASLAAYNKALTDGSGIL